MAADLPFTGERFVPGVAGEIAHEHWHRYAFARRFVQGRRTLDVACGEGYGSALLAGVASGVVGIDVAADAVAHARATYAARPGVRFEHGSASALPLADGSVDAVVSFETIEHLPREEQPRMLAEVARVLTAGGLLVLSAPNPVEYSSARNYRNPFHLHEPSRDELDAMLASAFPVRRWYRQRRYLGSAVWSEDGAAQGFEAWQGAGADVQPASAPAAMYAIVVAARTADALPGTLPAVSLYSDRDEAELARLDAQAGEVLRLDQLLAQRDKALDAAAGHVRHLEALVAVRERVIVERDSQLAAVNAVREGVEGERDAARRELVAVSAAQAEANAALSSARQMVDALTEDAARLERAIAAQERIISYRQSLRWWIALPWLRIKLWWQRTRGA